MTSTFWLQQVYIFSPQNCKEFETEHCMHEVKENVIALRPDTLTLFVTVDYEKARYKSKMAETNLTTTSEPEELDRSQRSRQ